MAHMHEIETAVREHDALALGLRRMQKWGKLVFSHDFDRHGCIIPTAHSDGKRLAPDAETVRRLGNDEL